jgi:hypothetical protein
MIATALETRAQHARVASGSWTPFLIAFAGWTLLAAIPATSAFIVMRGQDAGFWWRLFKPLLTYYYAWALVTPLIYALVARMSFAGRLAPLTVLAHLAVLVSFSTAATLMHGEHWRDWLYGMHAPAYHAMSAFSYGFALLACIAVRNHRIALEREREAADMRLRNAMLDGRLSAARIATLRAQINPHFLFNALNSIAALIESGRNDEGYRTTELLGELLRRALSDGERLDATLDDEIAFIETYLAIEKVRFGDRLEYRWQIDPAARSLRMPALLLQPLVENAIKHGVARSEHPVSLEIVARIEADDLVVEVRDDGPGLDASKSAAQHRGQGLRNVRERLRLGFPDRSELVIRPRASGGTEVQLRIPALG